MAYLCHTRNELYLTDQEDRMAQLREDRDRRIEELEEELEEVQEDMEELRQEKRDNPGQEYDWPKHEALARRLDGVESELESLRRR